jgi:hypothetical protein
MVLRAANLIICIFDFRDALHSEDEERQYGNEKDNPAVLIGII